VTGFLQVNKKAYSTQKAQLLRKGRQFLLYMWHLSSWAILVSDWLKRLGAIRAKIDPTSDVDKISSKMYSQYVLFRNEYN
jgi:hypothetical protein